MLLREHWGHRANLKNKVVFIGVKELAELWDETTWNSYRNEVEGKASALAEKLGQAGMI